MFVYIYTYIDILGSIIPELIINQQGFCKLLSQNLPCHPIAI